MILVFNAGSSSIKFSSYAADTSLAPLSSGAVTNISQPHCRLTVRNSEKGTVETTPLRAASHADAIEAAINWLSSGPKATIVAVGHRIVHGGPKYSQPVAVTDAVLDDLRHLTIFDPEHLPIEIELIEACRRLLPKVPQAAAFDTAFHHGLPTVARLLPIPRHYEARGVRRYGFHGLSYAFVMERLRQIAPDEASGRIVLAHLGSGASLAAVDNGQPIDTTMGLTPASGVPMSTRSGDLDPGLALYLARADGLDTRQFNHLVNFQSGLLGVSGLTADMEELLAREGDNRNAKDAVDLFCYQAKKTIGSFAAAMGGLDTLVFTGGIGEAAPKIRARICDGLDFIGLELDANRNDSGELVVSSDTSRVAVRVIPTDEALMIGRATLALLQANQLKKEAR